MLVGGRPSAEVRELWAVLLCQVTYYHVFTLQLIRLAKILRGVTGTLGMFLGMALNGMSLKELLAALGHSVDSNLLSDLQICHCNFHLSYWFFQIIYFFVAFCVLNILLAAKSSSIQMGNWKSWNMFHQSLFILSRHSSYSISFLPSLFPSVLWL